MKAEPPARATIARCRNCDYDLSALSDAKYCPECGQETDPSPPTVREFANHFFGNYISVRGSLARTVWTLFAKPGELTKAYIEGRKRAYVLPFRLYLVVSIATFFLATIVTSRFAQPDVPPPSIAGKTIYTMKFGEVLQLGRSAQGEFLCVGPPQAYCDRYVARMSKTPETFAQHLVDQPTRFMHSWGYAMFMLLPVYALFVAVVFWNRRRTYGEHLVYALHVHAVWLPMFVLFFLFSHSWIALVLLFAVVPIHGLLSMRAVYGGPRWTTIARASLITLLHVAAVFIAIPVVWLTLLIV